MTRPRLPAQTRAAETPFAQRCRALGMLAWRCDASGSVVAEPTFSDALRPWIESLPLRERVERAAKAMIASPPPGIAQVFPSCWLIPLVHKHGTRLESLTLVMVIAEPAAFDAEFDLLCSDASLNAEHIRHALAPLLKHVRPDLNQLAAFLRWSYDDLAEVSRQKSTLDEFSDRLLQSYEEANLLFRLARVMNCVNEPEQIMQMVCGQLQDVLPFQWVAIRFSSLERGVPELSGRFLLAGELPCPQEVFLRQADLVLARYAGDDWTRLLLPHRNDLAAAVASEVIADPITHDGRVIGVLLAGNKTGADPEVSSLETQIIDASADFLGVFHENIARFTEQQTIFMGTVRALTSSIDAKDRYTCGHSERVALLASQMVAAMGMGRREVELHHIAGLVHDVGKIGVPESVLTKTGRLTYDEFELIKRHPRIGYDILKDIPQLSGVLPGVLHHHERWDGQGYPDGLACGRIPLIARVLALADSFDAMSSNRSYRPEILRPAVFAEMQRCSGTQFDPDLVPKFLGLDFSNYDALAARHQAQVGFAA